MKCLLFLLVSMSFLQAAYWQDGLTSSQITWLSAAGKGRVDLVKKCLEGDDEAKQKLAYTIFDTTHLAAVKAVERFVGKDKIHEQRCAKADLEQKSEILKGKLDNLPDELSPREVAAFYGVVINNRSSWYILNYFLDQLPMLEEATRTFVNGLEGEGKEPVLSLLVARRRRRALTEAQRKGYGVVFSGETIVISGEDT